MAEVESPSLTSATQYPTEPGVQTVDISAVEEPHPEHEAFVTVEPAGENSVPRETGYGDAKGAVPASSDDTPETKASDTAVPQSNPSGPVSKGKASMSTKPTAKANGTPLVKKIINSGTFGTGTAKSAPIAKAKSTGTSVPKAVVSATSLKKSASSSAASPIKPSAASTKPAETVPSSTAARRASVVPTSKPAAPLAAKTPLSSSTSTKPAGTGPRPSVVSPSGSGTATKASATAKPRASVSEGIKKAPASSRQSLSTGTKPLTKSSTNTKPGRTASSISSIREVREDGKALEDIQNKLKETISSLESKREDVVGLEARIDVLTTSLNEAQADIDAKRLAVEEAEKVRQASETELMEVRESLRNLQATSDSQLQSVQSELDGAKAAAFAQNKCVQDLEVQIQTLEAELLKTKENFKVLQTTSDAASAAAASTTAIEREELLKAKADITAMTGEIENLKAAHADALEQASAKLNELEKNATLSETMELELAEFKSEKERNANKLSELEIEILELKESQEAAEDERGKSLARLKSLEDELAKAISANERAIEDAKVKDEEYACSSADAKKLHEDALKAAAAEQAKVVADLEALRGDLASAQVAHEQATAEANSAMEELTRKLNEAELIHLKKQNDLSEEVKMITAEVESQEAKYNSKLDAVKAEHNNLLQEAYERAKTEAGNEHSQDLQSLRAESQATIEQLRTAHQTAIDGLIAEHADTLESQVKALEKKLSSQNLELKATQEDLSKAKASLNAARTELENLTTQRDEARAEAAAAAATPAPPDLSSEIEILTKKLAHSKDDQDALAEQLSLTKASLTDMSDNHTKELEQAAQGRAEEVMKLRTVHDEEVATLTQQKSEVLVKLSDLEGDLATLKASIEAESASSLKSNGVAHPSSPGVTKEELQRMHEAHNLKLHDIQAEHDMELKVIKEELDANVKKCEELRQEVARKAMEIQYLEQQNEDGHDQITRLKEDLGNLAKSPEAPA